jgi:heat shock protein HslJ
MKIATIIMALFFFGTPAKKSGNVLADTHWSFVKLVTGETIFEADTTCGTSLNFDKNGEYHGFSGWNHYNGKYKLLRKGKLTMEDPMRTKKAGLLNCKLGERLFEIYPKVKSYTIKSDSLYLCTSDCMQAVFVKR